MQPYGGERNYGLPTSFGSFTPYSGPNPSPARRWAPWLVAACVAAAVCDGAQVVLNLRERSLQQAVAAGRPTAQSTVHNAINAIHTASQVTLFVLVVLVVLDLGWTISRRPRTRLRAEGEARVEASLRKVAPIPYWGALMAAGLSFVVLQMAKGSVHAGSVASDFARYREYLAIRAALGMAIWMFWIVAVVVAEQYQRRREALAAAPPPWAG